MGNPTNEKFLKALETTIASIEKQEGKGAIFRATDGAMPGVKFLSSQSIGLDLALGGGWAMGRIIEIWGPESSGKTTVTLHAIAEAQKQGIATAFVDAEHALDPNYARALGVNMDELLISQPDCGEQALEIVELLVRGNAIKLIVIDSVAALVPKAELEGDMGQSHMGLQARLMSQALRKLTALAHKAECTIFFINQIRMKIGIVFGNPEVTTGGNALKYYASQRVEVRRVGKAIQSEGEAVANRTKATVKKNKVFPPFREAEFDLKFGVGIDRKAEVLQFASDTGIVDKSGSWYSYKEERLGQGQANVLKFFEEHTELFAEIEKRTRVAIGI